MLFVLTTRDTARSRQTEHSLLRSVRQRWIRSKFLYVLNVFMRQESRLLDSLINEVVVSVALEVHGRAKRAKMDCLLCDQPYVQNVSDFSEPTHGKFFAYFNEAGDSATYVNGTKTDYYSNNPLFECLVCSRQVSSNRYATHLEKCMGIGNKSVRKSSIRNAKSMSSAATQRLLHTNSRSASPATSASSQPRKQRTASPAPSKEMPVKGDQRASTPLAKQVDVVSKPTTTAPTKAESTKTKDKSIPPKLSASAAPVSTSSTPATSTPAQADEDAMFDDADFPSGFDLSVRIFD